MFSFFRDRMGINKRFVELENSLIELSNELGTIKAQIARINAKIAVEARENIKKTPNFSQIIKKLGYDIVYEEPINDGSQEEHSSGH